MLISLPFLLQVFCFLTLEALCALEARAQVGSARLPSGGVPLPPSRRPFIASLCHLRARFCAHFVKTHWHHFFAIVVGLCVLWLSHVLSSRSGLDPA